MSIPDLGGASLCGELGAEFIAAGLGDARGGEAIVEEAARMCHDASPDLGPPIVVDDLSTSSLTCSVSSNNGGTVAGHGDVAIPGDAAAWSPNLASARSLGSVTVLAFDFGANEDGKVASTSRPPGVQKLITNQALSSGVGI
jgi:hypothetical protein